MNDVENILESFNLDPLNSIYDIDPFELYSESDENYIREALSEASEGTTKQNIFQKLWNLIKKAFAWIASKLSQLFNFFRNLGKKKQVPIDNIVSSMNLSSNSSSIKKSNNSVSVNDTKSSNITKAQIDHVQIDIPASPKSEISVPNKVDLIFKPFKMAYDSKADSIHITINDTIINNHGEVKGQEQVRDVAWYVNLIVLIEHPEVIDMISKCIKLIHEESDMSLIKQEYQKIENIINKYYAVRKDHEISLAQIKKVQYVINEANKALAILDNVDDNLKYKDPYSVSLLNKISLMLLNYQLAINGFTSVCQQIFSIDASYVESINDVDKLSEFINKCIGAAIPPKYIAYNAYLISNKNIRGDSESPNQLDKPIWGQTRFVFFPPNKDFIYKMPLSQLGIRANKSEADLYNAFNKTIDAGKYFAKIVSITNDYCLETVEKVDTDGAEERVRQLGYSRTLGRLSREVNEIAQKLKIPMIIDDIHDKNVGLKNGNMVIVDFGMQTRTSTS